MEINGIEGLSAAQIESEIERGGKFVTFHYCISIVIMSFKLTSEVYFIRAGESGVRKGLKYTLVALLLGWWGIPFGIFWTIQALVYNLKGGRDVTKEALAFLTPPEEEQEPIAQLPTLEQVNRSLQKTCPQCAESIQLDAMVCRFCGHQFSESEVQALKQHIEEQAREDKRIANEDAARKKIESKKKGRRTWGWVLSILGGSLAASGGLLLLLLIASNFIESSALTENPVTIYTYLCCPVPIVLIGLGIMTFGVNLILHKKANKAGGPSD